MAELTPMLSTDEVQALTGGLVQPAAQLRELHRRGYVRATRSKASGAVLLERLHYLAVAGQAANDPAPAPASPGTAAASPPPGPARSAFLARFGRQQHA